MDDKAMSEEANIVDTVEFIISKKAAGEQNEYLCKIIERPYKNSVWITEKNLKAHPDGKQLINNFRKLNVVQFDQNHGYDPSYDIVDKILDDSNGMYLVKWTNLPYTALTTEKSVDEEAILIHQRLKEANYAMKGGTVYDKIPRISFISSYSFAGHELSQTQVITVNSFISSYNRKNALHINLKNGLFDPIVFGAMCEILHSRYSNPGPFLIVCSADQLLLWYDTIRECQELSTICYSGNADNREIIHKYLFQSDGTLKFHVLITTADLLSLSKKHFQGIKWSVSLMYDSNVPLNSECTIYAHNESFSDYKNDTHDLMNTLCHINMADEEKEKIISIQKQFQLFFPSHHPELIDYGHDPSCTFIDCPFNELQKIAIRNQIVEYLPQIQNKDFQILRSSLERICHHPYLLNGQELFFRESIQAASTKLLVLEQIIKKSHAEQKKISIVSQYSKMLDMIQDLCEMMGVPSSRGKLCNGITLLYTRSIPDLDEIDLSSSLIYIDSKPNDIKGRKTIIRLLCNDVGENDWDSIDDEMLCKYITIKAFENYQIPNVNQLLQNEMSAPKILSKAIIMSAESPTFWDDFFDLTPVEKGDDDDDTGRQFTLREQNQFIRGLFSIGWHKWDQLKRHIGINLPESEMKNTSDKILRLIKQTSGTEIQHYIIDDLLEKDPKENTTLHIGSSLMNEFSLHSSEYVNKIELLQFLHASIPDGSSIDDIKTLKCFKDVDVQNLPPNPKPEEWWNENYDYALLLALSRLGLNSFDDFGLQNETSIKQIFKSTTDVNKLEKFSISLLNRLRKVCSVEATIIGFFISQDIKNKWNYNELVSIIHLVLQFGLPVDLKKLPNASHTEEEVNELIEDIFKNLSPKADIEEFDKTINLVFESTSTMKDLHFILDGRDQEESIYLINKAGKWRSLPKLFKAPLEYKFFSELLQKGFDQAKFIIEDPEIAASFGKTPPPLLTNFNSISNRVHQLAEFIRSNSSLLEDNRFHKKSREVKHSPPPQATTTVPTTTTTTTTTTTSPSPQPVPKIRIKPKSSKQEQEQNTAIQEQEQENKSTAVSSKEPKLESEESKSVSPDHPAPKQDNESPKKGKSNEEDNYLEEEDSDEKSHKSRSHKKKTPPVKQPGTHDVAIEGLNLPMDITQTTRLLSLGHLVTDRKGFHTERYLYPAGFKTSRIGKSTLVPNEVIMWYSEIIDTGEEAPLFRVSSEDGKAVFEGVTPTAPWSRILKENAKINGITGRALAVSGPEMYLFSNKTIYNLLTQMPGIEQCTNFIRRELKSRGGSRSITVSSPEKSIEENVLLKPRSKPRVKAEAQNSQSSKSPTQPISTINKEKQKKATPKVVEKQEHDNESDSSPSSSSSSSPTPSDSNDSDFTG